MPWSSDFNIILVSSIHAISQHFYSIAATSAALIATVRCMHFCVREAQIPAGGEVLLTVISEQIRACLRQ
jgi:hypothetical protein